MFSSFRELKARACRYGDEVSTYDWLKFIAIVLMTVDHIGAYLIIDNSEWYRTFGRICVPIWLFFAGYSQSRILGGEIIWLGIVLAIINYFAGSTVFPLNILFSIVICRYVVFWLKECELIEKRLFDIFIACAILSLPSTMLFEYGTLGVCFAVMGDLVRRNKLSGDLVVFTILSTLLFIAYQYWWFNFTIWQYGFVVLGTGYTVWLLYHFKIEPFAYAPQSGMANYIVRLVSRNTLHYYFYHRILLQLLALLLGMSAFKIYNFY